MADTERHDDPTRSREERYEADRESLSDALHGLSQLVAGAQTLEVALERIAALAVVAIPGADGVGVVMKEANRADTIAVSDPFVRAVDDVQYSLGEGPCLTAANEARTVVSASLGADLEWPRFGAQVSAMGVHSALSLPLVLADEVVGALNVYAHDHEVFDAHAAELGEFFAGVAAVAVHNARVLMQAQRLADQLQTALRSRSGIDQAIGIVMSRVGCNAEQAFARLRTMSQNSNVKLNLVAERIVDDAVGRARARHSQP